MLIENAAPVDDKMKDVALPPPPEVNGNRQKVSPSGGNNPTTPTRARCRHATGALCTIELWVQ